jgi:hypothetical protein
MDITNTGVGGKPRKEGTVVDHPAHYNMGGIECIDALEACLTPEEFQGFCKGNAMKYLWRERFKNENTDKGKAQWYLNRAIEAAKRGKKEKDSGHHPV